MNKVLKNKIKKEENIQKLMSQKRLIILNMFEFINYRKMKMRNLKKKKKLILMN